MAKIDLLYKELSYKIVGIAYEVHNILGPGHKEKVYQAAFEELLKREKVNFKKQVYVPLMFNSKVIGKNFIDLIVDDKIVIELKSSDRITKFHMEQTIHYLKYTGHQLGLLILFSTTQVVCKRVLNLYQQ